MGTKELMDKFDANHKELISYIDHLSDEKFSHAARGKWTPGQQLAHVYLCLLPISQALSSRDFIHSKFGVIDRDTMSYEETVQKYQQGLAGGGKAPERFLPEEVTPEQKPKLVADMLALLDTLKQQVYTYTDGDLDTLVLPHPFLGKLTIREMLFLMAYHATHHLRQTENNLL